MKGSRLIELERKAVAALEAGDHKTAIDSLLELLKAQPDYEHGLPHYHLARALEGIGDYGAAALQFRRALEWEPDDPVKLGGYAAFLYLHGDPGEAFDLYLRLAKVESAHSTAGSTSDIRRTLIELAGKMGISTEEANRRIQLAGVSI
jgi:Tfp pilus assembly protein PilF